MQKERTYKLFSYAWLALLIYVSSPALGIASGAALTVILNRQLFPKGKNWGKLLLQTAIVLIGFNLDAVSMWTLSKDYIGIVAILVILVISLGLFFGKLFRVESTIARLIATGTAICGGTTVVTLAPIMRARADQVALTLAIIFGFNMIALLLFPWVGQQLGMSELQFGVWSALSIHDTSSVVATAAVYSDNAASIAATVKLGRTLWLIPMAILFSFLYKEKGTKVSIPLFIVFFIIASLLGTLVKSYEIIPAMTFDIAKSASRAFLVLALFFVGTECTRETLKNIRGAFVLQSLSLWIVVVAVTLTYVITQVN